MSTPNEQTRDGSLSPRWLRVLVYAVMVIVALAAIRWIDRRAMQRMYEFERAMQSQR